MKAKYGAEAGTSPDGKQFIERQEQFYVIGVSGLPNYMRAANDQAKQALMKISTLSVKDKEPIPAAEIQFDMPRGTNVDAYFLFPRTKAFTLDDKEVEFATKFGSASVKTKFRFKDMAINGKLDL